MRHLLEIDDLTLDELRAVLELARRPVGELTPVLAGRGLALLFQKPSTRTRNSMEIATVQLGGHPVYLTDVEVGLETRETLEDVTRTLGCYHAGICARVFSHAHLERMAGLGVVPVVNLLSDEAHPMQGLADALTLMAEWDSLEERVITYVGDANNVARSLALACGRLGARIRLACPPGYQFDPAQLDRIRATGVDVEQGDRPADVVPGSDAVYTDVWTSMGQEAEAQQRRRAFEGFTVTDAMLAGAPGAVFLHCLPAHRGEEVAAEVIDGPRSRVWPQAENRLHAARGVLAWLYGERT
jgi:ornithine carbamoyltransferase